MPENTELIFTICSANYLSQAVSLGYSLQRTNHEVQFRIYLVDRLEGREEIRERVPFPMIEIEQVPVIDFEGMVLRYNVVELNTSVKPYIFHHIFNNEPEFKKVIYFDPDILVFQPLSDLFHKLDNYNIVITPHILTPSDSNQKVPTEQSFLGTGIFNLGFIAISRSEETLRFINWWMEKLLHQGYTRLDHHLFYDQKWINYVPVFFDGVHIEKNKGYNTAPWNLHERFISKKNKTFFVNENSPLIFYHFSSYKAINPSQISKHTKYNFDTRPDLKEIYQFYHSQLIDNGENYFRFISYFFHNLKIEIMRKRALDNSGTIMRYLRIFKYFLEKKLGK
jgi:hypothetical protein